MSFDFSTLITDRTNADVSALSALLSKKLETWTPEELEQFNSGMLKGGYWWTDLNRVTACMEYLDAELRGLGYESGYSRVEINHPGTGSKPSSRLPEGYTEIEYIKATGTQYIDSGLIPSDGTKVTAKFQLEQGTAENLCLFGVFGQFSFRWYGTNSVFRSNGANSVDFESGIDPGSVHTVEKTQTKCTIDGVYSVSNNAGTVSESMLIFAQKTQSLSAQNLFKGKLFFFESENGELVPCKKDSGEVGLYDLSGAKFLSNSGNGYFEPGPEVGLEEAPSTLDQYTWYKEDSPKIEQLQQYIDNVAAIRSAFDGLRDAPDAPTSPRKLTVEVANNIEKILLAVETAIQQTVKCMVRSNSFAFWSGNRPFPTADSNKGRTWGELDAMQTGWRNWQVATWYLLLYGNLKAEGDVV